MAADARVRELLRLIQETDGTPEDVCRDCPELLDEVRRRLIKLRAFDARLDEYFPTDVDDADPGDEPPPAPQFPGYEISAPLGAGGMGVVYKARELASGRVVALKVVHPHLRRLPGFVERLAREAEIGRRVVHENVVRTVGLATDETRAVSKQALVTEHVEGQTLRALLREMGRVPEQLCRHVGREIANGLAAIHAAGAVHRDLKPENVIITGCTAPGHDHVAEHPAAAPRESDGHVRHQCNNVVKVMDLGVAKLLDAAGNLSQDAFVGSLRYAAPEQIRRAGGELDRRADLYSLGLTLYELSTGRYAFQSDEARQDASQSRLSSVDTPPRRAGELNPQLSALFEELLAKLMENDREKRFASAGDVADVLEQGEESAWWRGRSNAIRRATRNAPRRIRIPRETDLHGRDADLALLRVGFACASNGDGRVVLVQGEAGVGKSRLIDEFVARLHEQDHDVHVLFGGYAPGGAATASGAFSAAYREFLGDEDLNTTLRRLLPKNPALVPAFSALLRGEPPPAGTDALSKDALQTAFTRTTQSLAAERPTVVVIEDLHFAPEAGRALFAALALAVPGHRVLLVGTARRTLDPKWAADLCRLPHVSRLTIGRLGRHELTALVADALRSTRLAEELVPQIERKSDGNPYFVFELLRGLRESGLLQLSVDGAWTATQTIRDIRSPSSILDVIAARIAELLPEERELIEVAACCGFEFDPLLVGGVVGLARLPLLRRLGALESVRRLVRSTGRLCVFDHHQIQEVLYAGLSQTHREAIHCAIAEELESASGVAGKSPRDVSGMLCAELASHFLRAGAGARANAYLTPAVDYLTSRHQYNRALDLCRAALGVPGLLDGTRRAAMLVQTAHCAEVVGDADGESACLAEARTLADAAGSTALRAKTRWDLGVHLTKVARFEEARSTLIEAIALYREIGDESNETGAMGQLALVHTRLGRTDLALELDARCIDKASRTGDLRGEDKARTSFGIVLHHLGRFDEARSQFERALVVCRELGVPRGEMVAHGNLGNVAHSLGLYSDALAHHEAGHAIATTHGDRGAEARADVGAGHVLSELGLHDEARTRLERGRVLARETGSRYGEMIATAAMAHGFADEERYRDAETLLEECLSVCRGIHARHLEADALLGLGAIDAAQGRVDRAIRRLDQAVALAGDIDFPTVLVAATAERARLPGGTPGDALAALAAHGARVDVSQRMCVNWLLWLATRDASYLAEARSLLDHLFANAPERSRKAMRSNVRVHREILDAAGT